MGEPERAPLVDVLRDSRYRPGMMALLSGLLALSLASASGHPPTTATDATTFAIQDPRPVVQHPPFVTSWTDKHGTTYTVTTEVVQGNPSKAMLKAIEKRHDARVARLQLLHPPA